MSRLWSKAFQDGLHELLDAYEKPQKTLSSCPLCSARRVWENCNDCPWVVMTGKVCIFNFPNTAHLIHLREMATSPDTDPFNPDYGEMVRFRENRILEINAWIKVWEIANGGM